MKVTKSIKKILSLLEKNDHKKLLYIVVLQVGLNFFDLIGVALIGVIGALSVTGISSRNPGTTIDSLLNLTKMSNLSLQQQIALLAAATTIILVGKTVITIFVTRRALYFLSVKGASISKSLVSKILSQSLTSTQKRSAQDNAYIVDTGVNNLFLNVLGASVILVSDLSLAILISLALFIVSPSIAISLILFFGAIGYILYFAMNNRAQKIGQEESRLSISINNKLIEVLSSYREAIVRNRRAYYANEIGRQQLAKAHALAEKAFMPNISKYVIEISLILGALLVSGAQFLLQDATQAIATLSIFLAAGSRVAPASLRIQHSLIQIKTSLGISKNTLDLIDELKNTAVNSESPTKFEFEHPGFISKIRLENINYSYPGDHSFALKDIDFELEVGKSLAIVGTSGAGKTTLVDILLGVITPSSGKVKISGISPIEAIRKWPGAISYVPQDVLIVNGTIRENISLGFELGEISDDLILSALSSASLEDFIHGLPLGLDTEVGERGAKISGGQRQRIGIARAIVSNPALIVLDEATSSLDGETEAEISNYLNKIKGRCTVVMIAHRLSSVRSADTVLYLDHGKTVAIGNFEYIKTAVPKFEIQASLMGL